MNISTRNDKISFKKLQPISNCIFNENQSEQSGQPSTNIDSQLSKIENCGKCIIDEKNFVLNTKKDLLNIPIKDFLELYKSDKRINPIEKAKKMLCNNSEEKIKSFCLKGKVIKNISESVVKRFEKESIKEIKLSQKLFVPKVSTLKLCVDCPTVFGENLKITGNNDYLGNWQNYKDMTYSAGQWTFEIKLNTTNYENDIFSTNEDYKSIFSQQNRFSNFEFKFLISKPNGYFWENTTNRNFNLEDSIRKIEYNLFTDKKSKGKEDTKSMQRDSINYFNSSPVIEKKLSINKNSKFEVLRINKESNFFSKEEEKNDFVSEISDIISNSTTNLVKIKLSNHTTIEYNSDSSELIIGMKFNSI